ncbi:MAG: Na+/H+ antiporter NhaA [Gemmatimonadota bacterium]
MNARQTGNDSQDESSGKTSSLHARFIQRPARKILSPLESFAESEASGGILLLACAAVALVWANSPLADSYFGLWDTPLKVGAKPLVIDKPLLLWINDGLMAVFFLFVGLEMKREFVGGELADLRQASLPVAAALGGMIVPAGLYAALNVGTAGAPGWGIPMATDIAFALGVLALLGSRVPAGLKVLLAALAIVDDLGAVLVITLFYTSSVSVLALAVAAGFVAALVAANRLGVQRSLVYVLLGLGLWVAVLKSGVHATVAGVLLALTVPIQPGAEDGQSLLLRMEHALAPWVAFAIVPVFALANAGVRLVGGGPEVAGAAALTGTVGMGVMLGLVAGKQIGVTLFAWGAVRSGLAVLPNGVTWRHVYGVACLSGIGFTMSIFIATLAFPGSGLLDASKIGILVASLISGVMGWVVLRRSRTSEANAAAAM